nr:queuosine precursor transporter [Salinarimonas ramus]
MRRDTTRPDDRTLLLVAVAAMAVVVLSSNILVQHPIQALGLQDWLTWGAFTYPFAFLVTDLANRRFGPAGARKVVYAGFALAVALSIYLATPRIAIASGIAFLSAQLVDVAIFNALRAKAWWLAPLTSSILASALDTALFFSLAFYCGPVLGGETISGLLGSVGIADECIALPWQTLALADWAVKLAIAAVALVPYGAIVSRMRRYEDLHGAA